MIALTFIIAAALALLAAALPLRRKRPEWRELEQLKYDILKSVARDRARERAAYEREVRDKYANTITIYDNPKEAKNKSVRTTGNDQWDFISYKDE